MNSYDVRRDAPMLALVISADPHHAKAMEVSQKPINPIQ
jgi:hypothetical protein